MSERGSRDERKNLVLLLAEGATFIAGTSFISPQTVLPALVARLGGGNIAVGTLGVILWFGVFLPQVFAARLSQSIPRKKPWAIGLGLMQRGAVALTGLTVLLLGTAKPEVALAAFLLLYLFMQFSLGLATPVWYDMFAKMTPVTRRGRLTGMRNALGGVGGLVCGSLLTWILVAFVFPVNYAMAFLGAVVFQGTSIALQFALVEDEPSRVVPRPPIPEFFRQIRDVLGRDREFRAFLRTSAFLVVGGIPAGFFTVYALERFAAPDSVVGEFTLTLVAVQVLSAPLNGYLADRYGNRLVLSIAAGASVAASVWAILAPSLLAFRAVFVFVGINLGSELMARYNMSVEYGPPEHRALYIGLMNTVLAPLYLLGLVGGWLAETLGFSALFLAGGCCAATAGGLFLFRVRDPRLRHSREGVA